MRDYSADDFNAVAGGPSRLPRLRRAVSTAIGATVAVALLLALGVWFYRLGARDAENVPIIRASAEPTKTRPEEPGGVVTPYQEITSYGIAEGGKPAPTAVVMAPPAPGPRDEDVAMGTLASEPAERPAVSAAAPDPAVRPERTGTGTPLAPVTAALPPDPGGAAAEAETAEVPGAVDAGETPAEADEIAALVRQATLDAATSAKPDPDELLEAEDPRLAPLPPARPSDLRARIAASVRSAEESAAELARRAAESPFQIQLAADPDEQAVRAMWRRISQANSDILHDRELAVQPTSSGGTTYYRLRVGPFAGVSEARAVCSALQARGQDCIVARNG